VKEASTQADTGTSIQKAYLFVIKRYAYATGGGKCGHAEKMREGGD
jgi:hypothetical protein